MSSLPLGSWSMPRSPNGTTRLVVRAAPFGFDALVRDVQRRARRAAARAECKVALGRTIKTSGVIEQAVYVERSPTVGAFALVRWRDDGITIEVGPTSRRQRSLQWAVLIAALACSFGGTVALGPWSQPRLAFLLALLVGLALGILLLTVVARRSIAMDSAPSRELAERLLERLRPMSAAPE